MNNLAKNLLFLRKKRGWTQDEMPRLVSVSRVTWGNYENGNTEPDLDRLINISEIFMVRLDHLLTVDLKENAHLIKNEASWKLYKNAHLNAYLNAPDEQISLVSEPDNTNNLVNDKQLNWLILQGVNQLGENMLKVMRKLDV